MTSRSHICTEIRICSEIDKPMYSKKTNRAFENFTRVRNLRRAGHTLGAGNGGSERRSTISFRRSDNSG